MKPSDTVIEAMKNGAKSRSQIEAITGLDSHIVGGVLMGLLQQGLVKYESFEFQLVPPTPTKKEGSTGRLL